VTLNIKNGKYYDALLRKVEIDHYVRKIWLLKYEKSLQNLKRFDRRDSAVCAL